MITRAKHRTRPGFSCHDDRIATLGGALLDVKSAADRKAWPTKH